MTAIFLSDTVDFKLENMAGSPTMPSMRHWVVLIIAVLCFVGCESSDDAFVPGRVPKETAVAIAMRANRQYPYPLSKVTRVEWRANQGYWAIDFKDEDEDYGKFYLVNGAGKIVGTGQIQGDNYY